MGIVVTLLGYLPPLREDGVPWSRVHVEEAPEAIGPWAQIDDQALVPLDPDPSRPQARNVTTSNATLEVGWYRLTFFDALGGRSEPSHPERNAPGDMLLLPPAPDDIRNQSPLLRKKYPLPPPDLYLIADLRNIVRQAIALVESITWRSIDPLTPCVAPPDYQCEAVPDTLVPVAYQAVARMAERLTVTTAPELAEEFASGRLLRGFSAGPYREDYFAPGEFARRGAFAGRPAMDTDTALDMTLWALATEDARDYFVWRATGQAPPIGLAIPFDYRRETRGYDAGGIGGPPLGGHGGPDGF